MNRPESIQDPAGKLGVLMPGMGAVATTFVAGVEAIKAGLGEPVGSLTQMGTIRLGKRTENRSPRVKDFVPLAGLDQLCFGGWDVFPDDACTQPPPRPASSTTACWSSCGSRCRRSSR